MKKRKNRRRILILTNLIAFSSVSLSFGISATKPEIMDSSKLSEANKIEGTGLENNAIEEINKPLKLGPDDYMIDYDKNKFVFKDLPQGYRFKFTGSSVEQIIDNNLNIHRPLEDKEVIFTYELIDDNNPKFRLKSSDQKIQVKSLFPKQDDKNLKPKLVPEISEWYSNVNGNINDSTLKISETPTLFIKGINTINQSEFSSFGETFKELFKDLTGRELSIIPIEQANTENLKGNFIFDFSRNTIPGYDDETYGITIDEDIKVTATHLRGAIYAAQTLMQMMKLENSKFDQIKILKGQIKDYPKLKLRGFSLDVSHSPFTIKSIKDVIKQLSWFKENELELTLSGNADFLGDLISKQTDAELNKSFDGDSGFRLESDVEHEGRKLASQDFRYSKAEFKELMNYAKRFGIRITPKFNFSGNALSITKVFRDIANRSYERGSRQNKPFTPNIDFTKTTMYKGKMFTAPEIIKLILDEYVEGHQALFGKDSSIPINIGGENFEGNFKSYIKFMEILYEYFEQKGITLRLVADSNYVITKKEFPKFTEFIKKVEIVTSWRYIQAARHIFENGYKIININESTTVVPGLRSYFRLQGVVRPDHIFDEKPDVLDKFKFPVGSKQLLGWLYDVKLNRNSGTKQLGLTEFDIYKYILEALPHHSRLTWGKGQDSFNDFKKIVSKVGEAPLKHKYIHKLQENRKEYFRYDFTETTKDDSLFDKRGSYGLIKDLRNIDIRKETRYLNNGKTIDNGYLEFKGGDSSAKLPIGVLGVNNSLKFRILRRKLENPQNEEIIFWAKSEYGNFAIKAKQKGSNKFGFSRENIDYIFDYEMPYDKWEEIELRNTYVNKDNFLQGNVELYVNGQKKGGLIGIVFKGDAPAKRANGSSVLINTEYGNEVSKTFMFPLEQIGHSKNSFKGNITNIIADPLNPMLKPETKNIEFLSLEDIKLNFNIKKVNNVNDIVLKDIEIIGFGNGQVRLEDAKIKKVKNIHSHIIVEVTLSIKTDLTEKFTREYYVPIETLLGSFLKEVLDLKKNSNLRIHPQILITKYEEELDKFHNSVSMLPGATEEKITELRKELEEIIKILKTFRGSLDDIISDYKNINGDFYLSESFNEFRKAYQEVEPKTISANASNFLELYNKLQDAKKGLLSNKNELLKLIEIVLEKADSEFNTAESILKYNNSVNEIKNKIDKLENVPSKQFLDFDTQLKTVPNLVTFNQSLEIFVQQIEKEIKIEKYKKDIVEDYKKSLQLAKNAIMSGHPISKQNHDILIKNLNDAKEELYRKSSLGAGAITAIVLVIIAIISGGLGLIWFFRKRFIEAKERHEF